MNKHELNVEGLKIRIDANGYVSLTDIARKADPKRPDEIIRRWIRNNDTISFLSTWEKVHSASFKPAQMSTFRNYASSNINVVSVKKYVEQTGAIGIFSKSGRYGGTYAHSDIALNFCYWLSPEFQVYLHKEFQRLKNDEAIRLGQVFDLRRELAKTNYAIQTDAIKGKLLASPFPIDKKNQGLHYANEADLLNVIVFGCTAKQWREQNPDKKGNIRDHATIDELLLLLNMESLNAHYINENFGQEARALKLREEAYRQRPVIATNSAVKRIKGKEE